MLLGGVGLFGSLIMGSVQSSVGPMAVVATVLPFPDIYLPLLSALIFQG